MVGLSGPARRAVAEAEPAVFWSAAAPERAPLPGAAEADLVIVGGGLTGLWAAVLAKDADPGRDVLVLEGDRIGSGGSGRNGGFLSDSLTHGLGHGAALWPEEIGRLVELGRRNLAEIAEFTAAEGIAADLRLCGRTEVATEPHQVGELRDEVDLHREYGIPAVFQGAGGIRADVRSPLYRAGMRVPDSGGLVDPAKLTAGLAAAAERRGVRVHERSPVRWLRREGGGVALRCPQGMVRAARVLVATSAFPAPLRRLRRHVLPIWDYVLVTEPLPEQAWAELGWRDRQGITDAGNLFHYYRPTADGRILWGGGEPYWFGRRASPRQAWRAEPPALLAESFLRTFPQLEGVRFSHRWGGAIDSTTRFTPLFGTALQGRVGYAVGFTGLGVGASRFGAQVVLDLLAGRETERTATPLVRSRPLPFPPLPGPLVRATRRALRTADRTGRRGRWLRLLDRHGVGLGG